MTVTFRPLTRGDFPLVARWWGEPHVTPWWQEEPTVEHVEESYGPAVDGADPGEVWILEEEGTPVGLFERYRFRNEPDWARAVPVEGEAAGIDYLIGDAGRTAQGLGTEAIRAFCAKTFADYDDVDVIVAVPQQANRASGRALEKAGFRLDRAEDHIDSDDPADQGPAFVYVLAR